MRFFPDTRDNSRPSFRARQRLLAIVLLAAGTAAASLAGWQARAALPRWLQDAVGGSAVESALYRVMALPGAQTLYPRPPKEAQDQLTQLLANAQQDAALYSLRALEEEQALDFPAAEADWKAYASKSTDKIGAQLELADYYHRRLQASEEIQTLLELGSSPAQSSEEYVAPADQRSWKAFERILPLAADQSLDDAVVLQCYSAWIARYPRQPSLYARELQWLLHRSSSTPVLDKKRSELATQLIADYRRTFPQDAVFPLKATALLEYRNGSVEKALATYNVGFTPLWPPELVQSYFSLLTQAHQLRRFFADAQDKFARNPDDLNAMARLFYYAQQQGNLNAAQQTIEAYRLSKEERKANWSAQELFTLAKLTEAIHAYPEAARYNFALYHAQGSLASGASPQEEGLSGMISILLSAPDQPLGLGAGNLSMYRDIATLDRGPGYWNGILSLWLNGDDPTGEYRQEEQRAQPYFHRAKAAELLAILDTKYPRAARRAEFHMQLIHALASYGEDRSVLKAGDDFLTGFTASSDEANRILVAMDMADAYARQQDTKGEFALYDRILTELGAKMAGMPLTAASATNLAASAQTEASARDAMPARDTAGVDGTDDTAAPSTKKIETSRAFEIGPGQPIGISIAGAQAYKELLERYLGRLTATGQLPQALAVLKKEVERNPNDPLLYERLAAFLEQNNLTAQQEEVYSQAIQKFQEKSWYDKLARLYLREKKREAFATLTRQVTDIFSGTDLEAYFHNVTQGGPALALQLNLYAFHRFPHDRVFLENLLQAYQTSPTRDPANWEKLLREHWWDSESLRAQFFDFLSRTGKLDQELASLKKLTQSPSEMGQNPAATRELAEAEIWRSHYEASAPLLSSLAESYPADPELGTQASSIFRSLAYFDSRNTPRAVAIEANLIAANPADIDRLARIGDIYADSGADATAGHEDLAAAAPYWRRMATVHPGTSDGYLQAATVFWDYFQFDDALAEIHAARDKFQQPSLFAFEAGAIEEGKRNLGGAIVEYTRAATAQEADPKASHRLLQLARRKGSSELVDKATAQEVEAQFSLPALELRVRVFQTLKRSSEIGPLLQSALGKAATLEQAQSIGSLAQSHGLTGVYELALQRQIALDTDPVEKIQISYRLAQSYENRKDAEDADRAIEAVYRQNPRLLGVVRATVDYDWRSKQQARAIGVLIEASNAASKAQPELSRKLLVEAAGKANDSGNYAQARTLMAPLIDTGSSAIASGTAPYNAQYLAVVADSYARAADDAGLEQFYLSRLDAIRNAKSSISMDDRKSITVQLRRAMIPTLTRMKDYSEAVVQYTAILSAYPQDPNTAQAAALYALRYNRQQQLVDFLAGVVKASPKDSRFAILLGQVQTVFQDFPSAIDAYTHAIAIRGDLSTVYASRAALEERLQRLDDAVRDYERLYVLSYSNSDWKVKIAAIRARQGRSDEAVKALEQAWIEGRLPTATDYFRVASQLEAWNMLPESLRFAELGVKAEGDSLLAGSDPGHQTGDDPSGARTYARLKTRLRQPEQALDTLEAARKAAGISPNAPSLLLEQAQRQGLAAVTDGEWRKHRAEERQKTADRRFRSAVLEISRTAATYFAPEEKQHFAALVDARWTQSKEPLWIEAASAAHIPDEEAKLRCQMLLDHANREDRHTDVNLLPYVDLEKSRMMYAEMAQTLENYIPKASTQNRRASREAEVAALRSGGDERSELRVFRSMSLAADANDPLRERYLQLLLKYDRPAFESYGAAAKDDTVAVAAPNYSVGHSDIAVTRATLVARGKAFPAAWANANSALSGLYFRDLSPTTEASFHSVLADQRTVGERVDRARQSRDAAHPMEAPENSQALAGDLWFYYAMRYGAYRTLAPQKDWTRSDPEDFLPAAIEHSLSAVNYIALARTYADAGKPANAVAEYRHALELAPDSAAAGDAIALLQWQLNKKDTAIAQWRAALAALNRVQDKGPAPESFWSGFALIADHLRAHGLVHQLQPDMNAVLRNYLARNGTYRSNELLKAVLHASANSTEGVEWLLSLSASASDPAEVLADIDNMPWLPVEAREPILLRELELARIAASHADTDNWYLTDRPDQIETKLIQYYIEEKQDAKARAILERLTDARLKDSEIVEAQIVLASRGGTLDQLLARFAAHSDDPIAFPSANLLRSIADTLDGAGDKPGALAIREFLLERGLTRQDLLPTDYLSLASARLQSNDTPGAVEVLRRMTFLPGDIDAHNNLAAELLEKGHEAEAIEFLSALAKSVPWNDAYALRLAQAKLHTSTDPKAKSQALAAIRSVASSPKAAYGLRVQAATALGTLVDAASQTAIAAGPSLGSEELRLIASGKFSPQQAQQSYFFAARIAAASQTPDNAQANAQANSQGRTQRAALLRQAIALDPTKFFAPSNFYAAAEQSRNPLLLSLARAEEAVGHHAAASSAIQSLLSPSTSYANAYESPTEPGNEDATADSSTPETTAAADEPETNSGTDSETDSDTDATGDEPAPAALYDIGDNTETRLQLEQLAPLPDRSLTTDAEKIDLSLFVATVYQSNGDPEGALPYLKLAAFLVHSSQDRQLQTQLQTQIQQKVDQLSATLRLEAQNALRRPKIQRSLDQASDVRPRLSAADLARQEAQ